MNTATVIEFSGVSFAYAGFPALEHVSLAVNEREFCALIGPNGGGKTTLLKLALGLLRPDQGKIAVLGKAPAQARADVGYVPQLATFPRDFPLAVYQAVLQGRIKSPSWWRWLDKHDKKAASDALNRAGISELYKRPIGELSGGQLQRVLIARALAAEPEILLLDEPTAHVDSDAQISFLDLLRNLRDRMTIVMVSHDINLVSKHVDRVVCLNKIIVSDLALPLDKETLLQLYGGLTKPAQHQLADR